jgi:[acyl-carrier-protein] S-malonyltransferase
MSAAPFAALFPGQLSEKAGMGEAFAARWDFVGSWFEDVSRRSGVDLAATFFGAGTASLHDDLPAQVGVFAVSVAGLDVLERVHGLHPAASAGYSLGTYAAFVAAGAVDRLAALDVLLTAQRFLEEDRVGNSHRPGGMGFVIGLPEAELNVLLKEVRKEEKLEADALAIGNVNAAQQFVLTGERAAVAKAIERARPKALRAEVLPIGLAMHSGRLESVTRRLKILLEAKTAVGTPKCHLYAPMLARRIFTLEEISSVLLNQISHPSLWSATLSAMRADGFSHFAEVGPGDVLARLLRWTLRDARGFVVESPESAEGFAGAMMPSEVVRHG